MAAPLAAPVPTRRPPRVGLGSRLARGVAPRSPGSPRAAAALQSRGSAHHIEAVAVCADESAALASRFLLLLLDNASIHGNDAYLRKLMRHIDVKFIPPYCYHLSPLDNGAFGCEWYRCVPHGRWRVSPHARVCPLLVVRADVVRFLRAHSDYYSNYPIERGLDDAFASVDASTARYCFYNAFGYIP